MIFIKNTFFYLNNGSRYLRRFFLLTLDLIIIIGVIVLIDSYLFTGQDKVNFLGLNFFIILFVSVLIYLLTGQYKGILKYRGSNFFYGVFIRNSFISFIYSFLSGFSFFLIQIIIFFTLVTFTQCGMRIILRDLWCRRSRCSTSNIIINTK